MDMFFATGIKELGILSVESLLFAQGHAAPTYR
jgi:hypothetical protein